MYIGPFNITTKTLHLVWFVQQQYLGYVVYKYV